MSELNVQNQQPIVWPRKLVVAKAYLDQLERTQGLPAEQIASLRQAIQSAETAKLNKSAAANLSKLAPSVESAAEGKSGADATRLKELALILKDPVR